MFVLSELFPVPMLMRFVNGFAPAPYTFAVNAAVCIETLLLSSAAPVFFALRKRATTLVKSHIILSLWRMRVRANDHTFLWREGECERVSPD